MITSSLCPIAGTSVVRSSSTQGLSRELIRVHSWVGPKSVSWAMRTRPSRGVDLLVGLDGVLEVAEQDVDGADHRRHLGGHLLVARVEEVDHPAGPGGDVPDRGRSPDRERGEEVLGAAHLLTCRNRVCLGTLVS
jgi:hypothetical protein